MDRLWKESKALSLQGGHGPDQYGRVCGEIPTREVARVLPGEGKGSLWDTLKTEQVSPSRCTCMYMHMYMFVYVQQTWGHWVLVLKHA